MAALVGHDSRQYSWWWVSHISPKNSRWLQENLNDMDTKVKAMIKLINEDADSFARRAEMYYKKRPELMKLVEEFYRAYRALAERYDQATGALRQAHRTISEAFPNQMPSMSDESPSSSGQEVEPHTPEMPPFSRAPFDSDDLQKDGVGVSPQQFTPKRNGTHPEETSTLSNRKGLNQFNDLSLSSENAPRAGFDGKVRKGLSFESPEVKGEEDISNEMVNLQQEISRLLAESQNMKQQILSESERANKAESEIQSLKDTVLQLYCRRDTSFLQYNQSTERLSTLESDLSKAQAVIKKLTDEMATEVQKLNSAETLNSAILSELEALDQKVKMQQQELEQKHKELESIHLSFQEEHEKVEGKVEMLEQELKHKKEEVDSLQIILQDEAQKRIEGEAALLSMTNLHSDSQEEVNRLALEVEKLTAKLSEVENSKMSLENIVTKHTEDIHILREQNLSTELMIKDLRRELDALKELNMKLETEVGLHISEKESLQRDFACQREEKENLEGIHHALADEMDALKSSAAKNQKFVEELQIMNLKLKEACAKNEVEKALLSEKVQEVEKLSEEYSLLENSLSDANAEMDALREKIKVLEASESSLKDVVSSHVSEKAVLVSELETLGKSFADISEKNSILDISLSNMKSELKELRTKLKDAEETCQAHLANNSALSAKKNYVFSQLESITLVLKALEGKHADLEDKHSSLSIEKDLAYDQVRELQGQLRTKNEKYEAAVKSHQMEANSFEEQISSQQEKTHYMDEMLEQEEQKNMSASISVVILENSLADVKDKNVALFSKCQKYAEANHTAEMLILQLKDEARYHEEERKTLLMHTEKLREGISQHMKVLNIYKDLGPANIAQDEILLQTVSDEIFNILKLKEESEDANRLMYTEILVLTTVLLQVGMELRDLHLQKCALEKEVECGAAELLSSQNKNQQTLECNEQLRQGLKKGSEREELLKTEVLVLQEKLSCLSESYQTLQDAIANLTEKNESLSKEHQSLIEKYNALEDENGAFLAECMRLEHLSLFLRGHNNEVSSALLSLTDDMALLSLIKDELDCEVQVLSRRAMMLESENNHLKGYFVYLVEILRTRLVLSEFDLNTTKSICQELAIELESLMAQLLKKDDELLEAEEKVQFLQEKNRELSGVVGALQVAIEGAKVVKGELEKKITTLTEEGTTKDDEILLLRRASETLQVEANILKDKEDSSTSAHEFMSKEVEQHEREFVVLMGDAITSSVNAAVYEEKALKLMMEGKAMEISAIAQKVLLMKEISSRDAHIEDLHKKVTGMQEENADLKAELSTHLALVASLSDHVNVLEEDTLSLSMPYSTEGKNEAVQEPCLQECNNAPESHRSTEGTPELQWLIARIEALRVVIINAKDRQDQESTVSAAKLAAANIEILELKARSGSCMEAREIYADEKQKDAEGSKGKRVQMMKDIELDQMSTCPPYGTGAALYPLGNGANAELDDEMLQLWEAAERNCRNQTAKSSSSEHDIQEVEEVKSEYPSSELARGRELGINKLEMSTASVEPHEVWSKNVLERLTSDAQRLLSIQASIKELKQKMGGPSKGKSPMNSEYNSVSAQLHETEGFVLEQINFNIKLTKKAENYPALSDGMNAEREGYSSRRKIAGQVQKGSENVARLELELQQIQYVLLKLQEEHEYRRLKVSDKRTRVLLKDYLYGRKDNRGDGQNKKKRAPFCGCVRPKSRIET